MVVFIGVCFVHWPVSKDDTIFAHVLHMYIMHDCVIATLSFIMNSW